MKKEELNDIANDLNGVSIARTGSAVDYSPLIKIALRLVIVWLQTKNRT